MICTEMETFSLEIRREHKCSFFTLNTQSGRSHSASVSRYKLFVGVTGQISVY